MSDKVQNVICSKCGVLVKQLAGVKPLEGKPDNKVPDVQMDVSEKHIEETGHNDFVDAPADWKPPQT